VEVAGTSSSLVGAGSSPSQDNAFGNLKTEDFIRMLVTQLQNQDPFNPTENQDPLSQMSEMRSLESTNQMMATFSQLLVQQRLASGASLIGKTIVGKTTSGEDVTGKVERVTVSGDQVHLVVGDASVPLTSVTQIKA